MTAQEILQLKQRVEQAGRLRSEAEIAQRVAQTKLDEIDAELRQLGVDPDQVDQELAALDQQITAIAAEVEAAVTQEEQAYATVLRQARQAGLVR